MYGRMYVSLSSVWFLVQRAVGISSDSIYAPFWLST